MCHFLSILTVMLGVSCSPETAKELPTTEASMESDAKEKVYLSEIDVPETVEGKKEIEVTIKGSLPSPAYKIEKVEVKRSGKTIKITPLASFDPNVVAIQMLVDFEEKCTISVDKYGVYKLKCFARDKTVEQKIEFRDGE